MQIKGLKKEFIEVIIEDRNTNGPYASLKDFLSLGLLWRLYAREGLYYSKKGKLLSFLHASSLTPYPYY